jgi:uroporphyrinogen-III synthase
MRVLVLRPDEAARRTAARLSTLGHDAVCAPVLEMRPTGEPAPQGVFEGQFDAIVATSAQAFRFADEAALRRLVHLPLLCVGARTGQAARAAGFANILIETPDAARLAAWAQQSPHAPKRLLYLVARHRKPILESGLAAAGAHVTAWVVYEARAVEALTPEAAKALGERALDAVLHFSPRSAAIFIGLVAQAGLEDAARDLLHVAISPDAARELDPLAPPRLRIAADPDEAHMLARLG